MSRRILVVEDDQSIRDSIVDVLETEGYRVDSALDGTRALEALESMDPLPDLILLDLMMPGMDGFTFRAAQKAHQRFAHIPVVVMSAGQHIENHHGVLGASMYLPKPIDLDQLLKAAALGDDSGSDSE